MDGNGYITREELAALLTHIPAAFEVLHALAEKRMTEAGPVRSLSCLFLFKLIQFTPQDSDLSAERDRKRKPTLGRRILNPKSLEERVASIVRTVFHNHSQSEREVCSQPLSRSAEDGLTYGEFCEALERNADICELLNLFYDWGMPDLPVPHDTLTPNLLHDRVSNFFCGRYESGPRFLGIHLPSIGCFTPSSSSQILHPTKSDQSDLRPSPRSDNDFVISPETAVSNTRSAAASYESWIQQFHTSSRSELSESGES